MAIWKCSEPVLRSNLMEHRLARPHWKATIFIVRSSTLTQPCLSVPRSRHQSRRLWASACNLPAVNLWLDQPFKATYICPSFKRFRSSSLCQDFLRNKTHLVWFIAVTPSASHGAGGSLVRRGQRLFCPDPELRNIFSSAIPTTICG